MNPDELPIGRRRLLGTVGAGVAAGIAGCVGEDTEDDPGDTEDDPGDAEDDPGDTEDDPGDAEDDPGDAEDEDHEEEVPADEAAAFPEGLECVVCDMIAEEYPEWNAQLVHEDGERVFFCSAGCMAAYHAAPEAFDGPDSEVADVWVTDFETGELIDAADAHFVRVTDPDHVDDVMMRNPTPFADRVDAETFVEEFEEYDDEDIITLEEFDRELGELYRGELVEYDEDGDGGEDGGGY